jgi:hypothetical protein
VAWTRTRRDPGGADGTGRVTRLRLGLAGASPDMEENLDICRASIVSGMTGDCEVLARGDDEELVPFSGVRIGWDCSREVVIWFTEE